MGLTFVNVTVRAPSRRRARVRMLVDSGATYSLLPQRVWKRLGLKAKRTGCFEPADGRTVARQVSECHLTMGRAEGHTPVILGAPGDDDALLGAVRLENPGLVLDPFSGRLLPMRLLLCGSRSRLE